MANDIPQEVKNKRGPDGDDVTFLTRDKQVLTNSPLLCEAIRQYHLAAAKLCLTPPPLFLYGEPVDNKTNAKAEKLADGTPVIGMSRSDVRAYILYTKHDDGTPMTTTPAERMAGSLEAPFQFRLMSFVERLRVSMKLG